MCPAPVSVVSDPDLPAQADVVVIGAGILGSMAAYTLAKRGHSVALLEKGLVGAEQSSRNWGWCRQQNRAFQELDLAREALRMWGGLDEELQGDTGFNRSGLMSVTDDPATLEQWQRWADRAREHQIISHILTPAEAAEMMPGAQGKWIGGIHTPTDGRAEPTKAAPAMATAARRYGATVHQGCAARGLETTGGRVSAVVTEKGRIRTDAVLCTGGAWSGMFCRSLGIPFPQAGVFGTAWRTTPAPGVTDGGLSTPRFAVRRRDDGGFTVGLSGRGRVEITPQGLRYARQFWPLFLKRRKNITLRVGRSFFDGPESAVRWGLNEISPFEKTRILNPAPDPKLVEQGMHALRQVWPEFEKVQVAEAWGGFIDSTPDAVPVISGIEKLPGFYLAAGCSGHGFGVGPSAGVLAADLVTGARPLIDPTPFRYSRMIDGTKLDPNPSM